jgi:hypothetical protein
MRALGTILIIIAAVAFGLGVYDTDEKFFLKGKTYVFENTAREFPSSIQARAHERKLFDEGQ